MPEMSVPICAICAKTGVLCNACEAKLAKGHITEMDVELAKIFYESEMEDTGFERAIDTGEYVIILTKKENIGKIIGKGGDNIRMISKKLGKRVRAIGTESLQDTIRDFVAPAQISSVNKVYRPDGTKVTRIRINKNDKKRLRMDIKEIERLVCSLTEDQIEISFDE
jgi:transcription antitermination factor NusA-like protein